MTVGKICPNCGQPYKGRICFKCGYKENSVTAGNTTQNSTNTVQNENEPSSVAAQTDVQRHTAQSPQQEPHSLRQTQQASQASQTQQTTQQPAKIQQQIQPASQNQVQPAETQQLSGIDKSKLQELKNRQRFAKQNTQNANHTMNSESVQNVEPVTQEATQAEAAQAEENAVNVVSTPDTASTQNENTTLPPENNQTDNTQNTEETVSENSAADEATSNMNPDEKKIYERYFVSHKKGDASKEKKKDATETNEKSLFSRFIKKNDKSNAEVKDDSGTDFESSYDPNHDNYYDDVTPDVYAEPDKFSRGDIMKVVGTFVSVIVIIAILIFCI